MSVSQYGSAPINRSAKVSLLLGTAVAGALLFTGTVPARADEQMLLANKIDVPQDPQIPTSVCVPGTGLGAFDISFVDPKTDLYILADRTNAAVDFFDASDDTYIGRVGGFAGIKCNTATPPAANNSISGA